MTDSGPPIFIVEDEPKLARLLEDYLAAANYQTEWFDEGRGVVDAVRARRPRLILLDLMLPGVDGLAICREVRAFSTVPIVMVTARVEEIDRLLGLELGADDYVCKPYSPREVVARVKAILRRTERTPSESEAARLIVDDDRHVATLDGQPLELTPVEFRLLKTLAAEPGRIVRRDRLLSKLYTDHRIVTDRTVDTHVKNLRRKLTRAGGEDIVRSIYGVGYKVELERS